MLVDRRVFQLPQNDHIHLHKYNAVTNAVALDLGGDAKNFSETVMIITTQIIFCVLANECLVPDFSGRSQFDGQ